MREISELSFPFDSDEINGMYDREYLADDFAEYFRAFITSGVFLKESTNLQVFTNNNMTVRLKPGSMIIDGYRYTNRADIIINISPADGVMGRIDRISATWSKEDRDIHYTIQKGVLSYNPIEPACRRNAEYKDYVVADIHVRPGAIQINQTDIVDQRLNKNLCGLATPFAEINTETLYEQLKNLYIQVEAESIAWNQGRRDEFDTWFATIRDILGSSAAGNIQNQIGNLAQLETLNKKNLVSAINELNKKELDTLKTKEEVIANTQPNKVVDALVIKGLNSDLAFCKNRFNVIQGISNSGATYINYPTGFTYQNTVVLSGMSQYSGSDYYVLCDTDRLSINTEPTRIRMNANGNYINQKYKITIMRTD